MKKILKNILIFLSYFIYDILFKAILYAFNINYYTLDIKNKIIYTIIIGVIYILILIFLYRKELKEELKDYKDNYKKYLSNNIIIYLIGVLLMGVSNIIISKITHQSLAGNEEITRGLIKLYPIYMIYSSIIFAPLVEELIIRKSLKNILKFKYLFIILSGLIFGLLHISDYKDINEILFSIPYIIMGIDFAYIYYKTNNIFTTMTLHMCHNLILLIIQFII